MSNLLLKSSIAFHRFNRSWWNIPTCILVGMVLGLLPYIWWMVSLLAFLFIYVVGGYYLLEYYYNHTTYEFRQQERNKSKGFFQ